MSRIVWLLPLAVVLGLIAPASSEEPKPDPKKKALTDLLGKLKEKRGRGGNQVYKLEFERTFINKGVAGQPCRTVWEFQFDWPTGKFRLVGWDGCAIKPFEIIKIYDGEKIKTKFRDVTPDGKPTGDGSWKYGMITGIMTPDFQQRQYWPMFLQRGVIAGLNDYFSPGHLVFRTDEEKLFVDGEVVRDGRKCISLKTFSEGTDIPMQYEYSIDPDKDYSVVGYVFYRNNIVDCSLDIKVVEDKKQPGRWVLSEWTYVGWSAKAMPEQTTKVKVVHFVEDVPVGKDNAYDIVYPEGAKVGRGHYGPPKKKGDYYHIDRYQYEVKNGKLVQLSGSPEYLDWARSYWPWMASRAVGAVAPFVHYRGACGNRGLSTPPGK